MLYIGSFLSTDSAMEGRPKALVLLAGVLCRGAAGGVHPARALLRANLTFLLRERGFDVEVAGFDNVPPIIDGLRAPSSGGRSLFPGLIHYQSWAQSTIDASPLTSTYRALIERANTIHTTRDKLNLARVFFLEDMAMRYLRWRALPPRSWVILMTPDLCLFGGALNSLPGTPAPGTLYLLQHSDNGETENGFVAGDPAAILTWRARHISAAREGSPPIGLMPARSTTLNYEKWWTRSTRHFQRVYLRSAFSFQFIHRAGRFYRGYRRAIVGSTTWPWPCLSAGRDQRSGRGKDATRAASLFPLLTRELQAVLAASPESRDIPWVKACVQPPLHPGLLGSTPATTTSACKLKKIPT